MQDTRWSSKREILQPLMKSPSGMAIVITHIRKCILQAEKEQKIRISKLFDYYTHPKNILFIYTIGTLLDDFMENMVALQKSTLNFVEASNVIKSVDNSIDVFLEQNGAAIDRLIASGVVFVGSVFNRCAWAENQLEKNVLFALIPKVPSAEDKECVKQEIVLILETMKAGVKRRFLDGLNQAPNSQLHTEIQSIMPDKTLDSNETHTYEKLAEKCEVDASEMKKAINEFSVAFQQFITEHEVSVDLSSLREFFRTEGNQQKHDVVNKLYRYVLTIPPTQVECERNFSIMKATKNANRSRLIDSVDMKM